MNVSSPKMSHESCVIQRLARARDSRKENYVLVHPYHISVTTIIPFLITHRKILFAGRQIHASGISKHTANTMPIKRWYIHVATDACTCHYQKQIIHKQSFGAELSIWNNTLII